MSNETIGMIITAILGMLGILFGGTGLVIFRAILKALKESTEVGVALDMLVDTVKKADEDAVWEGAEIAAIKTVAERVKEEAIQAKKAWEKVHIALLKKKK